MLTANKSQLQAKLNGALFKALYDYGKGRDRKEIENLLIQGADVNAISQKGNSPLHTAIQQSHSIIIIKMLLKYGARVNTFGNKDRTPLHNAVLHRNRTIVKELLINGADVNAQDCDGITPLELHIKSNTKKKSILLENIAFLLLFFGTDLSDKTEANSDPVLQGYIEEFKRIKRDYSHCAKLIKANENPETIFQYNEDTQKITKELKDIRQSYGDLAFNALQDLRQYMLQKSSKIRFTAENSATVNAPAMEADTRKPYILQDLRQHILQRSTIKLNLSNLTTSTLRASLKRKTIPKNYINNNLPYKKRKFQENIESHAKPSSELIVPNIPNKQINILEVIHCWGRDMFL